MNAITLLINLYESHQKECENATFKNGIATSKQATGKCTNCDKHFGAKA